MPWEIESLLAGYRMEHSQVLFIFFMIKNSLNKFPTRDFLIISTEQTLFQSEQECHQHVLHSRKVHLN